MVLNGRYKLLERLGSGGMASVYKAQDLVLGRLVAIKVLHESLTGDAQFLRRFQQEAHSVANLTHPNIVTVHDIGQDGRRHYIVMEYVEGPTLKQVIRDHMKRYNRPLPINRALNITIQICNGIGYAHRAGLVHCDLKPQNVLVTRDDRVKVADFGIARAISQASLYDHDVVWGTPQYFAPEQAAGEPATPASDVYAIGIILFEALTGRLPFDAESHTEMALKHMRETPPPVSRFNPNVPKQLEDIIKKVLAKEPAGRYRTGGQLGRILSTYRDSSQQETPARVAAEADIPPVQRGGPGYTVAVIPQPDKPAPRAQRRPQAAGRAERETVYYQEEMGRSVAYDGSRPAGRQVTSERPTAIHIPAPPSDRTDWLAITLGIAALIALLGLIPLWYLVYQAWIP